MLSSVAERVYWLGRYLERAESSARLVNVYSSMMFDLPKGAHLDWSTLLAISGSYNDYIEHNGDINEKLIVKYILFDAENLNSIFNSLKMARENARTSREVIPSEAWVQINDLYIYLRESVNPRLGRQARNEVLEKVIAGCQRLEGLFVACMSHNEAYAFIELGKRLERADMTSRLVDVGSINLLPSLAGDSGLYKIEPYQNLVWMNVLRCLSAYQAYRQYVHNRVSGEEVVRFLLQDEEFPRAISFCLDALIFYLDELPHHDPVKREVLRAKRICHEANVGELLQKGLLEFIDKLQVTFADIHLAISDAWFQPVKQEVDEE